MEKLDVNEKLWGGIFGLISILAAFGEMFIKGVSSESVFGVIKDVSGTLVVVVLLVVVVRNLIPKKYLLSFEKRLEGALTKWQKTNSNMIIAGTIVNKKNDQKYDISIRTDVNDFYKTAPVTKDKGMFLRMPLLTEENYRKSNIVLEFHLRKELFFRDLEGDEKELREHFEHLNNNFCNFINSRFQGYALASGKNTEIFVHIIKPIISDDDIEKLIEVINGMYQAYLVSAYIKIK
jgi:hypothetical protein